VGTIKDTRTPEWKKYKAFFNIMEGGTYLYHCNLKGQNKFQRNRL
jgi:hypothetical protein